jgi:glycosyltransferase involved in cell wall biosynthesis
MRILQVGTCDVLGGAEFTTWNLYEAFRTRGHESWLAVGRKQSSEAGVLEIPTFSTGRVALGRARPNEPAAEPENWLTRQFERGRAGFTTRKRALEMRLGWEDFNFPGTFRLLKLFPQPPDILHCHNLHGSYFDLRALPWLSRQAPLILNLHDAWLLSGHCAHSLGCTKWKTGCGRCPDLSIYPRIMRDGTAHNWRRKREIFAHSRLYVTTVCQWLMDLVKGSMLQGAAYRVIYNGIDLNVFHPGDRRQARIELGLPADSRIVLHAAKGGSQSPWRDFAMLEQSMQRLETPGGLNLLLLCLGEDSAKDDLVAGRLRVQYRAFEPDANRMAQYYRAADVYAHPARAESFARVITEAMACGTPVVATAVGGIPEQVEDGRLGFLVPPGDVAGMTDAIRRLLFKADLRQTMGDNAADRAKRRFGLDRQIDDFLDWYGEVRANWLAWRSCASSH